ncbi:hypothetical protein V5F38_04995 [Xanthobacter sp. V0B-10]|uniref:hypothetical protein n=1 Tax=Xanthobacter albus TaxID=3119929 RepID=UPI0037267CED
MIQLILSFVPWWLYAAGAVAAYIAARRYLGEKIALLYAIAAAAWVAMDYGGDAREAWLRAEGQKAAAQADATISAAANKSAAELQSHLDAKARQLKEATDALETLAGRPGCSADDVLDRLPGWSGRP